MTILAVTYAVAALCAILAIPISCAALIRAVLHRPVPKPVTVRVRSRRR